jgi:hypothetical protein
VLQVLPPHVVVRLPELELLLPVDGGDDGRVVVVAHQQLLQVVNDRQLVRLRRGVNVILVQIENFISMSLTLQRNIWAGPLTVSAQLTRSLPHKI